MRNLPLVPPSSSSSRGGFTLIEVMIVVGIIALLATIAIPRYLNYILKARTTEAHTMLATIKIQEYTNLSHQDCFMAFRPDPPVEPVGTALAWDFSRTFPASFCNHGLYAFADAGVA